MSFGAHLVNSRSCALTSKQKMTDKLYLKIRCDNLRSIEVLIEFELMTFWLYELTLSLSRLKWTKKYTIVFIIFMLRGF